MAEPIIERAPGDPRQRKINPGLKVALEMGPVIVVFRVTYKGVTSDPVTYNVVATVPGIYTQNSQGSGPGSILNSDLSINGPTNTAEQGGPIPIVYGRMRVGSALVSSSVSTDQVEGAQSAGAVSGTTARASFSGGEL